MSALKAIAQAIRDRRCILFAGSGLSRNAGLPTWAELSSSVSQELTREGRLSTDALARLQPYLSAPDRAVTALGLLIDETSRRDVVQAMRNVLLKPAPTEVFELLQGLKLKGALTTNYDRLLEAIFPDEHYRLNNSLAKLSLVPTAVSSPDTFVLKLHGDIDDMHEPGSRFVAHGDGLMVITRGDFDVLIQGDRGEALRLALFSVLQQHSLLFIGYSFTDPDITWMLRFLLENFQFPHQSWFLTKRGENTSQLPPRIEPLAELDSWQQLPDWLRGLRAEVLGTAKSKAPLRPAPARLEEGRRRALIALSRFLHDLATDNMAERVLAATFLEEIVSRGSVDREWMQSRISSLLEVGPGYSEPLTNATLGYLSEANVLRPSGPAFLVNQARAAALLERSANSWERDRTRFFNSLSKRLERVAGGLSNEFCDRFDIVLQDLSANFGETMAEWVERGIGREFGWEEAKQLTRITFRTGSEDLRVAEQVLELMFTSPSEDEAPYLYRLLNASFLANAVRLDPTAASMVRSTLASYELFLDANILLPLVVREHPDHEFVRDVLKETSVAGVKLFVIRAMFDELTGHRNIADRTAESVNASIPDLMEYAEAFSQRSNCFIQGYVSSLSIAEKRSGRALRGSDLASWRTYMANYTREQMTRTIEEAGIQIVSPQLGESLSADFDYVLEVITDEWRSRTGVWLRPEVLNQNEAEQFLCIYQRRAELMGQGRPSEAWFLSNETVLARVFRRDAGRWEIPPTFQFSAWAAFLDSRLPRVPKNPRAIVSVILKGHSSVFELPDAQTYIRHKLVGERIATKIEQEAIDHLMSGFGVVTGFEQALAAVRRRGEISAPDSRQLASLGEQAADEVTTDLQERVRAAAEEYERVRLKLSDARAAQAVGNIGQAEVKQPTTKPWKGKKRR